MTLTPVGMFRGNVSPPKIAGRFALMAITRPGAPTLLSPLVSVA